MREPSLSKLSLPKANRSFSHRVQRGKKLREKIPRHHHGIWEPHPLRRDPIQLLQKNSEGRIPELLPLRYGRMVQSPFSFFRGAAAVMAADLAKTSHSGIKVQLCGDCHLLNFGGFATPERRIIFDLNDFDETHPGPWEWDLKRLVTSFVIASRHNKFSRTQSRSTALVCAKSYRKHMEAFAKMRVLEVWYASIDSETYLQVVSNKVQERKLKRRVEKILRRDVVEDDFPKLVESLKGQYRIRDNPPLIYHPPEAQEADFEENVQESFLRYRESLPEERRLLLDRYKLQDVAMKVVGVGSVGTWCGILLHMAGEGDPLFLQVKQARPSVLEAYLGKSPYPNHGQRVVMGQKLMQSASDIFLGWTQGRKGRHFYVRQLRDMKIKPQVEIFQPENMERHAKFCGWALARAHAKSGDSALISGYLGKSDRIDEALADFAEIYARQNELDHRRLLDSVRRGQIKVFLER